MTTSFDDRVFDYVNDAMDADARLVFERELMESATLRADVDEAREALAGVALALTPAAPSPAARARLLGAVQRSVWERCSAAVARLWDVSVERVAQEFQRALDPGEWTSGPLPSVRLFHLEGGPAVAAADVGIVRFAPGTRFPVHTHTETEDYVVLQGRLFDSDGRVEVAGDHILNDGKVHHAFRTDPDEETVIALVLRGELTIEGPPPE